MVDKKELELIKAQSRYCFIKAEKLAGRIDQIEIHEYESTLGYPVRFTDCDKSKGTSKTQLINEIKSIRTELMILSKSLERL